MVGYKFLIAGLGNPGRAYAGTRHNIGFEAVSLLAKKHQLAFRTKLSWKGSVAVGKIKNDDVVLMKPLTFMNLSGEAIALCMRNLKIGPTHLLVIVDDIAISLGQLRMRINSGSGGHNGLKSVEEHLQTNRFARLRIGVGDSKEGDLVSHVLGKFSDDEKQLVPKILEQSVSAAEIWLEKGLN
ncbi:MAG TPA: aminoacyl-tRNA hydrolase [Chlamydiales bacterium]|nr:aminoacyl-tRNA hydrolase [Chlamydiales bacterium]